MINHDLDIEQLESRFAALVDRNLVAVGLGIQNLLLHFNENILGAVSEKEAEVNEEVRRYRRFSKRT